MIELEALDEQETGLRGTVAKREQSLVLRIGVPRPSVVDRGELQYDETRDRPLAFDDFIGIADHPVVREHEPNDSADAAQRVTVPCEFAGRFDPQQDRDWIEFSAKKGELIELEVLSQQLGLTTDPVLVVEQVLADGKTKEVAFADDQRANEGTAGEAGFRHKASQRCHLSVPVKGCSQAKQIRHAKGPHNAGHGVGASNHKSAQPFYAGFNAG